MFLQPTLFALALSSTVFSSPIAVGAHRNQTRSRATRASRLRDVSFAADSSIDVDGIYQAVMDATSNGLAVYSSGPDTDDVEIYGDFSDFIGQPVFTFMADMDIDCDGAFADQCLDDPSGQEETSFGELDASQVPWIVIPSTFSADHSDDLLPNALGAVICNGQMFYAIFGDEMGNFPQLIGEASLLLGQTCFPDDGLSADVGHEPRDVAYIVFGTQVPDGVDDQTIDLQALKDLGDQQMWELQDALGL